MSKLTPFEKWMTHYRKGIGAHTFERHMADWTLNHMEDSFHAGEVSKRERLTAPGPCGHEHACITITEPYDPENPDRSYHCTRCIDRQQIAALRELPKKFRAMGQVAAALDQSRYVYNKLADELEAELAVFEGEYEKQSNDFTPRPKKSEIS
jgi:hypothetical protein